MINRYHLFSGWSHEGGGMTDYVDSFATIEDAQKCFARNSKDWGEIVDTLPDGKLKVVLVFFRHHPQYGNEWVVPVKSES
jgi:hypothetical protein